MPCSKTITSIKSSSNLSLWSPVFYHRPSIHALIERNGMFNLVRKGTTYNSSSPFRNNRLDVDAPLLLSITLKIDKIGLWFVFCFCTEASPPSQHFFSHVGTESMLPGFNQYCRELMCLAQGHNMVPPVGIESRTSRFGV